jgi:signal transduction histidine kinase/CheY-like chemotaxis protein
MFILGVPGKMKNLTLDTLLQSLNDDSSVKSLIQSSPVCHKIFDPGFKLQFMSNSGVAALQIENVEDYYGQIFPTDSAPKITRDIFNEHMHLATKGETNTIEYSFEVDGNVIWFRTTISPFFDADGMLVYITADSMDITSSKKNEAALARSKEEAERANKAKSEFLSRMSHELRTPLNAILGFSQIMKRDPDLDIEERNSSVDHIFNAGSHLLELVDDVLDLSKIETGKFSIAEENINASLKMKDLISQIQPFAKEKGIKILNRLSERDDLFIRADRKAFSQIILNLLNNAIKYNIEAGSITVDGGAPGNDKIWLSVSDTGPGIAKENMGKLFEPFNRLGKEFSEIKGSGIGLSISKILAELMGGSISAECDLGNGCCFKVLLPVGKRESVNINIPDSDSGVAKIDTKSKSCKILYIEDNSLNLELVERILQSSPKVKFLSARHPREGIELDRTHRPDLILMDMELPEIDGVAAFKELQRFHETREIPVIALSAQAMPDDINKALNSGFRDYITKPLDIEVFLEKINEIIK